MRPSRGMGAINPKKVPGAKGKTIVRKDKPQFVQEYNKGGNVNLPGLYANIHAKRKRIAEGSKEKMRKVGSADAPSKKDFIKSAMTAKGK